MTQTIIYTPITGFTPSTQVKSTDVYAAVDTVDHTQSNAGSTKQYTIPQLTDYVTATLLSPRLSCVVATTGNLSANYNNGTSGVGATLTNNGAQSALTIDGISLALNQRVLVMNQTAQLQNGIYFVSNVGSASSNWILTRATDYDNHISNLVIQGTYVLISEGSLNGSKIFYLSTSGTITLGITALVFNQIVTSGGLSSFAYTGISGTSVSMNYNTGYFTENVGLTTLTMPVTAPQGSIITVVGYGAGGWTIQCNGGQTINIGSIATSAGGSISSNSPFDSVSLLNTVANTNWVNIGAPQSSGLILV